MSLRSWFRGTAPEKVAVSISGSVSDSGSGSVPVLAPSATSPVSTPSASPSPPSSLADAMAATGLILNDDIEGAEARLRQHRDGSAFHQLGLGISTFVRSILGFEKDIMAEATARLLECEATAWAGLKRAQRDGPQPGQQYPAGSEYALVHAEAQLMLAVVAVLHESLTEAIRGFYKLRKAFIALSAIVDAEEALGQKHVDRMPGSFDEDEFADVEKVGMTGGGMSGKAGTAGTPDSGKANEKASPGANGSGRSSPGSGRNSPGNNGNPEKTHEPAKPAHPLDVFVHSGANMCFGILLLLISMVPPAFSRLLYVIGFKGDRERGVRLLWQSTRFRNINGGVAGLVLLAYYNGAVGYCDIVPSEADARELAAPGEIVGFPRERCRDLLVQMRALYPDSMLWRLEEARALTTGRRLDEAIALLSDSRTGRMRQITALSSFELALDAMCAQKWRLMADTFVHCVGLNDWSHALYYYNAGCAELELYREAVAAGDPSAAERKAAAESHFRKAPTLAGRKKFMARQMPFEAFVIRKVAKWEERAKVLSLDLADAAGVSPAQEMIYLWNGCRRMPDHYLAKALDCLAWERCTAPAAAVETFRATLDESAIASVCRASLLRSLGRISEVRTALGGVLAEDRVAFKGPLKDDYLLAAATYEAAALSWHEANDARLYPSDVGEAEKFRRAKVDECAASLEKVAKWESFVLDARIGMKVQTGLDTIQWLRSKKKWI